MINKEDFLIQKLSKSKGFKISNYIKIGMGNINIVMDKNRKFYNDKLFIITQLFYRTYKPEVKYLWHGTSKISPAIICEEGFD